MKKSKREYNVLQINMKLFIVLSVMYSSLITIVSKILFNNFRIKVLIIWLLLKVLIVLLNFNYLKNVLKYTLDSTQTNLYKIKYLQVVRNTYLLSSIISIIPLILNFFIKIS